MRSLFAATLITLGGCTTGQANTTPPINTGGGGNGSVVLRMSVGTVNFGQPGEVGLNLLETFRDAQGFTAIPISTATLTGPPGFVAPKHSKDPGSGKRVIPIGSHSNQFLVSPAGTTTVLAGADGFGIGPPGCSCPGINFYPFQPQFVDVAAHGAFFGQAQPYYGGPPAYPPTTLAASALSALVQIPSSSPEGFYFIALDKRPPAGRYTLAATYSQNGVSHVVRATATLHPHLLHAISATATSDHKGGVVVTVAFPPDVVQVLVNVIDANVPPAPSSSPCNAGLGFATLRFDRGGTSRVPDDLGNYGKGGAKTFCKGDTLNVQIIGFDYDDFGLGPPGNVQQSPALPASADVTYTSLVITE
ncbi:MAG: hypothetical protein JO192_05235 [Candidatus Eremiobacteraeota bacterium]|nr:hypothetical protein [Candidatus Eremiobacteraeota bacterium]